MLIRNTSDDGPKACAFPRSSRLRAGKCRGYIIMIVKLAQLRDWSFDSIRFLMHDRFLSSKLKIDCIKWDEWRSVVLSLSSSSSFKFWLRFFTLMLILLLIGLLWFLFVCALTFRVLVGCHESVGLLDCQRWVDLRCSFGTHLQINIETTDRLIHSPGPVSCHYTLRSLV